MSFFENLKKYGELIMDVGLQIKEDDLLVVRGEVENHEFINLIAEIAYKKGAKDVKINYRNQKFSKIRYTYANIETLSDIPKHFIDEQNYYMGKRAKILSIVGDDPNIFSDIDSNKINSSIIASSKALKEFNSKLMNNEISWCVVGAATSAWAKVVFPTLDENEAIDKLWNMIFQSVRLFEKDPLQAWKEHIDNLTKWSKFLNEKQFDSITILSDNGTNLEIKMPNNYIFSGASELNKYGEVFVANMPTEEVFSMPHKDGANGIVYNTKPLNYNGNLIDDFYLKFENGVVVDFDAKVGYSTLKNLLESDEGSKRLGEIAFVSYDSPISNTNTLFYNTLYDENASCHLALGKAYPTCIEGGEYMNDEELAAHGVNDSLIHVDFMIGDKTTNIFGVEKNGKKTQIFKEGNFSI
ncbi:aminopeptidase [Anaerosphaera multitolerans]|uniref:Aminopeptidase n=1 Tax=Anaerosphaera multitolerans TaxID=2487351 RepID=A0A437S766_9FIRM|nr:aminopeptidase [Anaerosphaera multitolerans]RVU54885.1 aminopeptidase [Anaerosphaera multitolerans]